MVSSSQFDWAFDTGALPVPSSTFYWCFHLTDGDPEVGPVGGSSERWVYPASFDLDTVLGGTFTGATSTVWFLGRVLS